MASSIYFSTDDDRDGTNDTTAARSIATGLMIDELANLQAEYAARAATNEQRSIVALIADDTSAAGSLAKRVGDALTAASRTITTRASGRKTALCGAELVCALQAGAKPTPPFAAPTAVHAHCVVIRGGRAFYGEFPTS